MLELVLTCPTSGTLKANDPFRSGGWRKRAAKSDATWMVAVSVAGVIAGALTVVQPRLLLLIPIVLVGALACTRPLWAPILVVASCALYYGIFLKYRVNLGPLPLSLLDLLPVVLFVAAISLPAGDRIRGTLNTPASVPLILLGAGLFLGTSLGFAYGAPIYHLVRVDSIEFSLLVGCTAGLIAGQSHNWQGAIVTAFYVAAILAAAQQMFSFVYFVSVGHSFWESLPLAHKSLYLMMQ